MKVKRFRSSETDIEVTIKTGNISITVEDSLSKVVNFISRLEVELHEIEEERQYLKEKNNDITEEV